MSGFSGIGDVARAARQMSSIFHGWDVFVFDSHRNYRGRICRRKDCPAASMDCFTPGCGEIPHLKLINEFKFDEREIFSRKIDILWTRKDSFFLEWQKDVLKVIGLKSPIKYKVYENQTLQNKNCVVAQPVASEAWQSSMFLAMGIILLNCC